MGQTYGDRWEVVEALSEGGQGHTFVVRDLQDSTETARYVLKRLKNLQHIDRFEKEVEAALALNHPNVLKLVAHDLRANEPFLVSEHCAGGTLRTHFAAGRPAFVEIFRLFIAIGSGLHHAHKSGITHRDIKPDNIFMRLPKVEPVIGDFGLCHLTVADERITATGEAIGPRHFMAPELEDGRADNISPKADVYSLGKLFYWMLTGGKIFSREKFRDEAWDLKKLIPHAFRPGDHIEMEHIVRVLDLMIVADPAKRISVEHAVGAAKQAQMLLARGYNPVGENIPQLCTYCGWGQYKLVAAKNGVLILACMRRKSDFGHVQMTRSGCRQ
jgi:serine/threonine protein kinase